MGGYRAFVEPRAQTNWFDEQNGNKYCIMESNFNFARQVFRSVRTKNLRIPLRRMRIRNEISFYRSAP